MQQRLIPGTACSMSPFIFGTAGLFSAGDGAARSRLLHAAVDHGFTHFDTAPYYGFGMAERDLAGLLKAHPSITLTTKVGLYSAGGENQSALQVLARKALGRVLPAVARPTSDFSVAKARRALDASLKRLDRDHVEFYLLHEPEFAMIDQDEWLRWLEDEKTAGRIGAFGVAGDTGRLAPFLSVNSPMLECMQIPDSLDEREGDIVISAGRPLQLTYGYVSAARRRGLQSSVADILRASLQRNARGAVIVSTNRVERLAQYSGAAAAVTAVA